ncbi:hypothetical protein ACTHHL_04475 [Aeribacillus composti]|uniref:hypothetical protein n=1 Tax=Aeribacillus composti TaxID=1868734 RepID=UPI002871D68C|nr:hypothetical protein [Aeribacillus pallidus]
MKHVARFVLGTFFLLIVIAIITLINGLVNGNVVAYVILGILLAYFIGCALEGGA